MYRDNFVLKGGMLVAAWMGVETRSTMDIDTCVRSLPLSLKDAEKIVENIIDVHVPDGVSFRVTKSVEIMEEHENPEIRFMLEAVLDNMRQTIKIDISTGDVMTSNAILFAYKFMFEDRTTPIWTYNLETLLSEKLETVMTRSIANKSMRDFYDIYIILNQERGNLDQKVLRQAFLATCEKRKSTDLIPQIRLTIEEVKQDLVIQRNWENYKRDSYFVGELEWDAIMDRVDELIGIIE